PCSDLLTPNICRPRPRCRPPRGGPASARALVRDRGRRAGRARRAYRCRGRRADRVAVLRTISPTRTPANSISCDPALAGGERMHFDQLKRREFITLLGGGVTAWPLAARAQQSVSKMPRIGIMDPGAIWGDHFRQALRDLGYVEGRNIAIEYRSTEETPDRLAGTATELAQPPVDVIVTFGSPPTQAADQAATMLGGSCHTARASPIWPDALPATCPRFCKALSLPTCLWSSRPSSTWLSTSRPRKHLGSRSRNRSFCLQTM